MVNLWMGFTGIWGSFCPYFTNFFNYHGYPNMRDKDTNIISATFTFLCLIGQNIAIPLSNKIGSRKTFSVATIIYFFSLLASSIFKNFYAVFFFYALCLPVAVGIFYTLPIAIGAKYYPHKKGLVTGLILGAFGLSGIIL